MDIKTFFILLIIILSSTVSFYIFFKVIKVVEAQEAQKDKSPVPWMLSIAGSIICIFLTIISFIYSCYFIAVGENTTASIIKILEGKDSEGKASYHAVYEYFDSRDNRFEGKLSMNSTSKYYIGEKIFIKYLPNSPHKSRVDSLGGIWDLPILFSIFSIFLFCLGILLRWNYKKQLLTKQLKGSPGQSGLEHSGGD